MADGLAEDVAGGGGLGLVMPGELGDADRRLWNWGRWVLSGRGAAHRGQGPMGYAAVRPGVLSGFKRFERTSAIPKNWAEAEETERLLLGMDAKVREVARGWYCFAEGDSGATVAAKAKMLGICAATLYKRRDGLLAALALGVRGLERGRLVERQRVMHVTAEARAMRVGKGAVGEK